MSILKKYIPLTEQAEQNDTYEAYKELITKIGEMNYVELFNIMSETKIILKVLCRKGIKVDKGGFLSLTSTILQLGATFLEANDYPLPFEVETVVVHVSKPYTGYTYEFIERKGEKGE